MSDKLPLRRHCPQLLLPLVSLLCLATGGSGEVTYEGSRPDLQGQLRCGPWSVVGPFKEGLFKNILETFNKVYLPEEQVLEAGRGKVDLSRSWQVEALPGMVDTGRGRAGHPEWTDGYFGKSPAIREWGIYTSGGKGS